MTKYGTYRTFRNKLDPSSIKRIIITEDTEDTDESDASKKLEKLANDEEWEELDFDPEVKPHDKS